MSSLGGAGIILSMDRKVGFVEVFDKDLAVGGVHGGVATSEKKYPVGYKNYCF